MQCSFLSAELYEKQKINQQTNPPKQQQKKTTLILKDSRNADFTKFSYMLVSRSAFAFY